MAIKRKTRMYEPWGYREENNYQGREIICENDLDSFFADTEYVKDDNKIYFYNKDGEKVGTLNVEEFVKSDSIVEKTEYKDGILKIYFTNGDIITIDLTELLDENEFKDGLIVADHVVKVLVDANSERWLSVSPDGVKVSGIQAEIDRLDERIDDEIARATGEEARIEGRLDQEIADRIADVDEEEARAIGEETRIEGRLNNEITRATQTEQALDNKINTLNAEIDSEERRAEAAEQEIRTLLTKEINDRIADVNEEEARAKAAEQALQNAINAEEARAISAETDLQNAINAEEARAISAETDLQTAITAEEARATSAETDLQAAIAEEGRRAQDAETDLQAAITAEEARATSAETALGNLVDGVDDKVDQEVADRKAEAVASAEYELSGTTPVINFYNANNEIIDTIDATEFIMDGMVDDVKIENDKLVITFNVDSGKETIEIPLTEIFDPSNYYTKADVDAIVDDIDEDIEGLDDKIDNAVSSLTAAITAEETRATGVEALKANAADVYTKGEIDGKETALQGGINANADAITDLQAAIELKADKTEIPTDFYTKGEVDGKDAALQASIDANADAITDLQTAVDLKANAADVYTKGEIDGKENALQAGIDANADAIALKADKTEIPTDFYTQEEVNAMMSQLLTRIKNLEEKESIVVASTAAEVAAAPADSDVVITSTEAIQALTAGTEYSTITIVGGNANNGDIKAKATDKLTMDGTTINGDKGASNGRVLISASTVDLKNITIESGSTAYNVFEGTQNTADSSFFTSNYTVSNLTVDNTELNHNVVNIYTPANDAVITIKDSYLNLDVDKSNLLRLANYTNATGVTVNFENVEWTYENAPASDWGWAGLVIYQPSVSDVALNGDTSKIATWTFNFKNCKYNGEVVDAVNYGEHNQVIYGYDINRTGNVSDISSIVTVNFE